MKGNKTNVPLTFGRILGQVYNEESVSKRLGEEIIIH